MKSKVTMSTTTEVSFAELLGVLARTPQNTVLKIGFRDADNDWIDVDISAEDWKRIIGLATSAPAM